MWQILVASVGFGIGIFLGFGITAELKSAQTTPSWVPPPLSLPNSTFGIVLGVEGSSVVLNSPYEASASHSNSPAAYTLSEKPILLTFTDSRYQGGVLLYRTLEESSTDITQLIGKRVVLVTSLDDQNQPLVTHIVILEASL